MKKDKLADRLEQIETRMREELARIQEVEKKLKEIEDMPASDLPPGKDKIDLLIQVLTTRKVD